MIDLIILYVALRYVFSETLKQMYGIKHNLSSLPVMPSTEGTWSIMHSWVSPTKSFLEFVMFSRFNLLLNEPHFHFMSVHIISNKQSFESAECLWMHLMHNSMMITRKPGIVISVYRRYPSFHLRLQYCKFLVSAECFLVPT